MILRSLIFLHRWVGVVICLIFLLWFPSGIGMMYWRFPEVTAENRLDRSPDLDPAEIVLSPMEAVAKAGADPQTAQVRLNSFDGRPVYRVSGGGGGRGNRGGGGGGGAREARGGNGGIIYADTGEPQTEVTLEMRDRIAAAWTGKPVAAAKMDSVEEPDQWTVAGQLRNLRPLYKYSWPSGEQVYIGGATGEVVQYTTTATRIEAHLSAIPHWVYYTPIRIHQPFWLEMMIWVSLIGTIGSIIGVIVGVWMYSPSKKYRFAGAPTSIPYRGQKRWHTIIGLVFGIATATWAFSGLLSLGPFPLVQKVQQYFVPADPPAAAPATDGNREGGGRRGGGGQNIAGALRGRVNLTDFASVHPAELLAKVPDVKVKELSFSSFAGKPHFVADLGGGKNVMLSLDGERIPEFNRDQIAEIVKKTAPDPSKVEISMLDQYDLYYLDRTHERPLPVMLAKMNDAAKTRYYIDPATANVVSTYSNRNWINRWLYNGLHSLNFPWLYSHRPLWDIIVIAFMLGGTALCVTSVVLSWRVLGRKLRRATLDPDHLEKAIGLG